MGDGVCGAWRVMMLGIVMTASMAGLHDGVIGLKGGFGLSRGLYELEDFGGCNGGRLGRGRYRFVHVAVEVFTFLRSEAWP